MQLQRVYLGAFQLRHHVRGGFHVLFEQRLRLKLFDEQVKHVSMAHLRVDVQHLQRHHHLAQRVPLRLLGRRDHGFTGPFLRD